MSSSSSSVHDFIVNENASHKVVIWAKSFCPHSKKTKETFKSMSNDVKDVVIHDLDLRPNGDGADIQAELLVITGQKTVPNVFIMNQHIGGNDNVQKAYTNGNLHLLLGIKK